MSKWIMMATLALPIAGGFTFYAIQNKASRLGGGISKPKAVWLFLALYLYFILPVICYAAFDSILSPGIKNGLALLTGLLYLRAFMQPVLMYRLKIWTPIMGIAYNLLCSFFLIYRFFKIDFQPLAENAYDVQIVFLLAISLGALLTDSFYAWSFYKIVGNDTQGDKAIWYASDDNPAFDQINRITFWMNILFISALLLWFLKMLSL